MGDKTHSRRAHRLFYKNAAEWSGRGDNTLGWVAGGATDARPKLAAMRKPPVGNERKLQSMKHLDVGGGGGSRISAALV